MDITSVLNMTNSLVAGDLTSPFKKVLHKIKEFVLSVGGETILTVGTIVFVITFIVGLFLMRKSLKQASASWAISGLAVVVSVGWIVIKNIFQDVGDSAKDEDWTSTIQFAMLVPTILTAFVYKWKTKQRDKQ